MIRGWLCLAVIIVATALASPALSTSSHAYSSGISRLTSTPAIDPGNVTAASNAFNYSLSSANIFTNATATTNHPVNSTTTNPLFKWFSTVTNTTSGTPIPGTAFNYTANPTTTPSPYVQTVSWTMTIPKTNCSACSEFVSFTLYGSLTNGTSENFTLTKGSTPITSGIFQGTNSTELSLCSLASTSNSTICGPTVKLAVDSYKGSTLTLTFLFGWNATTARTKLRASVGEVAVESLDNSVTTSTNSVMTQTGNTVAHYATFSSVSYNTTNSVIPWSTEVINIYYPSGFNLTQLQLNTTGGPAIPIFPLPSPHKLFERTPCNDGAECSQSLIAINMSDINGIRSVLHPSTVYITAITNNSVRQVSTLSGGLATQVFTSGDTLSVKVVNKPSIANATTTEQLGTLVITFPSALGILQGAETTATGGVYDFHLPSNCGTSQPLCATNWRFNVTFTSQYDLGNNTGSFSMDLLQIKSFSSTGGSNALSVQGSIVYGSSGNPAARINATMVAIDTGTPVGTPVTNTNSTHSSRLYISNVTLVNGAFTQRQSLIMLFTIVNPNASQPYNATLTIEHLWPGPQSHNVTLSIDLGLGGNLTGDFAFAAGTARTYQADISFTGTGVKVVLTKPPAGNPETSPLLMSQGTSPVVPNRPHAGLFKLTVVSTINGVAQSSPNSILSPTYAYLPVSLTPSRYLVASAVFQTRSDGSFSDTITSDALLGAKNLTVFVLARDASGIVVVNSLPTTGFTDSTTLIASADSIAPVAKGQSGTATLHLTSNSTLSNGITQVITVILTVSGNGLTTPQQIGMLTGVTIHPGQSVTESISFTAPSNTGTYTLTYSSPEYGGVLTSQSLQVTIIQGNLQFLIPAGIGVVIAIVVLGFYLVRGRNAGEEPAEEESKPKGPGTKTKTTPSGNPPSKSLTRTDDKDK